MKSYKDQMNNLAPDEILKGLLAYGLFTEKIPPIFTSENFYEYVTSNKITGDKKGHDYIKYENIRNINVPRILAIPHPFAYYFQVKVLSENWQSLQGHFCITTCQDKHKVSRVHIRKIEGTNRIFSMNYKSNFDDDSPEDFLLIKKKFKVCADISNCFPSVYTHSLPWALLGKNEAKKYSSPKHKDKWFNEIDFRTRNLKSQETNGLLIGPHSSNILAEIILTKIDKELVDKGYEFIRFIDDYTCFVETYEKAERFLVDLSDELKKFELTLNHKKSEIKQLPKTEDGWTHRLKHFRFSGIHASEKEVAKIAEVRYFIDLVKDLMKKEGNNSAILNYSIKIISNKYLGRSALEYYSNQLHHLLLVYPYIATLLDKYLFVPFRIEKDKISQMAKDLFELGQEKSYWESCSYALYWAIKYDIDLEIELISNKAINNNDCIFLVIAYLYGKKLKLQNDVSALEGYAQILLEKDSFDRYWLFIYEVLTKDDLPTSFKSMKKKKISFIKDLNNLDK